MAVLSVTVDDGVVEGLREVSGATGRTFDELHVLALENFLQEEREYVEAVKSGLVEADAGKVVGHEDVKAWIQGLRGSTAASRASDTRAIRRVS